MASAAKARASLNKELNQSSSSTSDDDDKDNNDGGSIATNKKGEGVDDNSDGGENEGSVDGGEFNEDDIEDAMNLFGGGDDDKSIGSGMNDYAAQGYKIFDCVWHWMDPFIMINERSRQAVEACILIEAGQTVDESATTKESVQLLREIGHKNFESEKLQSDMLLQLKGAQATTFTGKSLWRQQKDV